ncbi:Pantoate-beta-alanine ligase [Blyttiomyces helicus]|uniref:Pantoate--beta-alanine ligase n=1 Tax=Blyttiomyces helicus TaxID=388810 RepID=A0A4P9WQA2_9FUNG|nr:Pantoate-beta-alanine ligase [Blyttiomyces helicus]|eukprot:RKO93390.1 Pantoate-beta-alanine ligase [Blyttiomyces helicus]
MPLLTTATRSQYVPPKTPLVVHTVAEYRAIREQWFREGLTVGFVPTMGALHEGHLSLAHLARAKCDRVVSSIFVNPAQFSPTEDLNQYPRTLPEDLALLSSASTDVAFVPSVSEIYPAGITLNVSEQVGTFVEVRGKSHQMEGAIRPHFFRGVATVVTKLLNVTQPTHAFFGQKDGQQCAVLRSMVRDLLVPTELVVGATVREPDGLAMSSRNRYLTPGDRSAAPVLYAALEAAQHAFNAGTKDRRSLLDIANGVIAKQPGVELQYLSLANAFSLNEEEVVGPDGAILSGALLVGKTRIIDNVLLGLSTETWAR